MLRIRREKLSNGAFLVKDLTTGNKEYIPTEETAQKIERMKGELFKSGVSTEDKIRKHYQIRQLFKFNNCHVGNKLLDMIIKHKLNKRHE